MTPHDPLVVVRLRQRLARLRRQRRRLLGLCRAYRDDVAVFRLLARRAHDREQRQIWAAVDDLILSAGMRLPRA